MLQRLQNEREFKLIQNKYIWNPTN
jgi:hypothetical protein